MKLILVALTICSYFISADSVACEAIGDFNNVKCVSKTAFVLSYQDPDKDAPIECPDGKVCADVVDICVANGTPVCNNDYPGNEATCNSCPDATSTTLVCINKNQYSICQKGVLQESFVMSCPQTSPYCKAEPYVAPGGFRASEFVIKCGTDSAKVDCKESPSSGGNSTEGGSSTTVPTVPTVPTLPTVAPTQPFQCTTSGFFPDTTSVDCTSYFKCQSNTQGGYDKLSFSCSSAGTKFNPATSRCESNYTCTK